MKVELLKDLMLPANGTKDRANVGEPVIASIGDVVEVIDTIGKDWVARGLAKASTAKPTIATVDDGEGGEKHEVLKAPKPGSDRKTKIEVGATETKAPSGVVTSETLKPETDNETK